MGTINYVLAWEERLFSGLQLVTQILRLDFGANVGWAEGILSILRATPLADSESASTIGRVALGKFPPLHWAHVSIWVGALLSAFPREVVHGVVLGWFVTLPTLKKYIAE